MRIIDADELLSHKFKSASNAYMKGWNDAIDSIDVNAPTIEAEPIVRCKDCKYYLWLARCEIIGECMGTNGFCAWGEKRTDEVEEW